MEKMFLKWGLILLMPMAIFYFLSELSLSYLDDNYVYDIPSLNISKHCKRVLVFIPHQDDELFVAGPLIYNLRSKGIDTKVIFFTDGNSIDNVGHIRQAESIKANAVLGVLNDDVICMQFPERRQGDTTDISGTSSLALRDSMKLCIKQMILNFSPQLIVCSDLDFHRDHRLLAILFDESMGELLKENQTYHPVVLKGFSYQTSYNAVKDFYNINLLSTKKPQEVQNKLYETDVPAYIWSNRVRIPVGGEMVTHTIQTNQLHKALEEYRSVWVRDRAPSIINGDNVFWLRRTDNLMNNAVVAATSGNVDYLNDFKLFDSEDITIRRKNNLVLSNYLWQADSLDRNPSIQIRFNTPTLIGEMVLYDDPTFQHNITAVDVYINGRFYTKAEALNGLGRPTHIYINNLEVVETIDLKNFVCTNGTPALVEMELFNKTEAEYVNFSVLKLKTEETDDFLYKYYIHPGTKSIDLSYYSFGLNNDSISWKVVNEKSSNAKLDGRKLILGEEFECCKVKVVSISNPEIYDEVTFIKETSTDMLIYGFMTTYDKMKLHIETAFYRNRFISSLMRHTTLNPVKRFLKRNTGDADNK